MLFPPATTKYRAALPGKQAAWRKHEAVRTELISKNPKLKKTYAMPMYPKDSPLLPQYRQFLESKDKPDISTIVNHLNRFFYHFTDGAGLTSSQIMPILTSDDVRTKWFATHSTTTHCTCRCLRTTIIR